MNIDITPITKADVNNVYVNYKLYGIPKQVNFTKPAGVISMLYEGDESQPNFTYTDMNHNTQAKALKYVSSIVYISASDFSYQMRNIKIDAASLQITVKCRSLDDGPPIYCIFFAKEGKSKASESLTEIITDAFDNKNNVGKTSLDFMQMIPKNPDIAYFTQKDKVVGDIRYFLFLAPIVAEFDISQFGSLRQIDSQLLNIYISPSSVYTLNKQTMKPDVLGSNVNESFVGFREGMENGYSWTVPSIADNSIDYKHDLIGADDAGHSRVDPHGGSVMYYGEDMICQESGINSEVRATIALPGPAEMIINYIFIAILSIGTVAFFIYGIPSIFNSFLASLFDKNASGAATAFLAVLIAKNIFYIAGLAIGASHTKWAVTKGVTPEPTFSNGDIRDPKDQCVQNASMLTAYQLLTGIGGIFANSPYYAKYKDDKDEKYCKIDNVINLNDIKIEKLDTYSGVKGKQKEDEKIQKILSIVSTQVMSLFGFGALTFSIIVAGCLGSALDPKKNGGKKELNINKPTVIAGGFFLIFLIVIALSIVSLFSKGVPSRVYIGSDLDLSFSFKFGYLLIPKGHTPSIE
jgi:hypothetical protein